jgi:hypothetical protein
MKNPAEFKFHGTLGTQNPWRRSRAVFVPLDRNHEPLICFDTKPSFNFITYSYENLDLGEFNYSLAHKPQYHAKFTSNGIGESFFNLTKLFKGRFGNNLFIVSDVYITVSEVNKLFDIADLFSLDIYQASLSKDSYYSHPHTLHRADGGIAPAPFAEWTVTGHSAAVWDAIGDLGLYSISGYGMDAYLVPAIQRKLNLKPPAVVHYCQSHLCRPVSSYSRTMQNGLTPIQEMRLLRDRIQKIIQIQN